MNKLACELDALVFGGGAAGLWLLDELHRRSFRTLLIENRALGAGQTIASQGILHGGLKYALGGLLSGSAQAVGEMTDLWRNCLAGRAQPDLRGVRILSPCCYLWRTQALASMVGLIAARFGLRTPVTKVAPRERPPALARCPGEILRVDEQVIDVVSLLSELAHRHTDRILIIGDARDVTFTTSKPGHVETIELRVASPSPIQGVARPEGRTPPPFYGNSSADSPPDGATECQACSPLQADSSADFRPDGATECSQGRSPPARRGTEPLDASPPQPPPRRGGGSGEPRDANAEYVQKGTCRGVQGEVLSLKPRVVIFAAGEGNAELRRRVGLSQEAMQLRPLHMVMVRGPLPQLFGHCVDGNKTRVTITSVVDTVGRTVWQVGGEIAEKGVQLSSAELVKFARGELPSVLPSVDFTNTQWATYRINRAEGLDPRGARPEGPVWRREGSVITAWPTKLVLAPRLAEFIVNSLGKPSHAEPIPSLHPTAYSLQSGGRGEGKIARPPWETTVEWHD